MPRARGERHQAAVPWSPRSPALGGLLLQADAARVPCRRRARLGTAAVRVVGRLQHQTVPLQDIQCRPFQAVAGKEAPHRCAASLHLGGYARNTPGNGVIHRGGETDDAEVAAGAGTSSGTGSPGAATCSPDSPSSTQSKFTSRWPTFSNMSPVVSCAPASRSACRPRPSSARPQVGAVHRVHHVVDGAAVAGAPVRHAQEVGPVRRGQLFRQFEGPAASSGSLPNHRNTAPARPRPDNSSRRPCLPEGSSPRPAPA